MLNFTIFAASLIQPGPSLISQFSGDKLRCRMQLSQFERGGESLGSVQSEQKIARYRGWGQCTLANTFLDDQTVIKALHWPLIGRQRRILLSHWPSRANGSSYAMHNGLIRPNKNSWYWKKKLERWIDITNPMLLNAMRLSHICCLSLA